MSGLVAAVGHTLGRLFTPRTPTDSRRPLTPPLRDDGLRVEHVQTFTGVVAGVAKTYRWRFDEALRNNEADALAMRRDGYLFSLLRERQMPSARAQWHVEPEDASDARQQDAAAWLTAILQATPRFTAYRLQLLEALWYGRYAVQHALERRPCHGRPSWLVARHQPVHGDKLVFRHDGTPGVLIRADVAAHYRDQGAAVVPTDRGLALLLDAPAWRERFVLHRHECEDADYREPDLAGAIQGLGLRSRVYWLWWLRQEVQSWLLDYLNRVGAGGLTLIYYDEGNPNSKDASEAAANDLQNGNILLVPRPAGTLKQTAGVERIEPSQVGSQVLLDITRDLFDAKIERLFIGQTLSSSTEGSGLGGTGVADLHADTKYQLVAFDAENLDQTLTDDLLTPLLKWNVPGAPFRLRFVSDLSKPDPAKQLEAVNKAWSMGVTFAEADVRGLTGLAQPKPGDKLLSQQQQAGPGAGESWSGGPGAGQIGEGNPSPASEGDEGEGGPGLDDETNPDIQAYWQDAVDSGRLFDPQGLNELADELADGSWREAGRGQGGPFQYAKPQGQWSPYSNPKTGRAGWKSAGGRVLYDWSPGQDSGDADEGPAASDAPGTSESRRDEKLRRHVGVERGKRGDLARTQAQIEELLNDPQKVTPNRMAGIVSALQGLTVDELHELRRQYGGKRVERKGELIGQVSDRLHEEGLPAPGQLKPIDPNGAAGRAPKPQPSAADLEDAFAVQQRQDRLNANAPPDATRDPTIGEAAQGDSVGREPGVGKPWAPGRFGHPPEPPPARPMPSAARITKPPAPPAGIPADAAAFLKSQGLTATPIPPGGLPQPAPKPRDPNAVLPPRPRTDADVTDERARMPGSPGYDAAKAEPPVNPGPVAQAALERDRARGQHGAAYNALYEGAASLSDADLTAGLAHLEGLDHASLLAVAALAGVKRPLPSRKAALEHLSRRVRERRDVAERVRLGVEGPGAGTAPSPESPAEPDANVGVRFRGR